MGNHYISVLYLLLVLYYATHMGLLISLILVAFCNITLIAIMHQEYPVKVRRHTPWSRVRCHGSHECWFTHSQFHSQSHSRRHSLRITLKYTTLVHMRSGYAWTMKSWQQNKWRLGFNSVWAQCIPITSFQSGSQVLFAWDGHSLKLRVSKNLKF